MSDKIPPKNLLEWLGISDTPNWHVARPLGIIISGLLGLLIIGAFAAAFALLVSTIFGSTSNGAGSLSAGALIVAILGAPFLIWNTVIKQTTVNFQKESHITDRISKAVEQLGAEKTVKKLNDKGQTVETTEPNIEVRIGGLLSLERIAQDSTRYDRGRDHVRVMEILCACVRENARVGSLAPEADEDEPRIMRNDVQIALDVIKRRDFKQTSIEQVAKYRLDLLSTDFRSADLSQGNFRGALLFSSRFEFADLRDADFSAALFHRSVLNFVYTPRARFVAADMSHCRIDKPEPVPGGFVQSISLGDVTGLSLAGANLIALDYISDPAHPTFGTKDTTLSDDLHDQRQEARGKRQEARGNKRVSKNLSRQEKKPFGRAGDLRTTDRR